MNPGISRSRCTKQTDNDLFEFRVLDYGVKDVTDLVPVLYSAVGERALKGYSVTPAPLTVTAGSPSVVYGSAIPAITPTYTGLVNGQSAPRVAARCSTVAKQGSDAGSYSTACSGASDANYAIRYAPGTLTIDPAGTEVSITSGSTNDTSTYGETVTFTAAVSSRYGRPSGLVEFSAGKARLGTATLTKGTGSLHVSSLDAGSHTMTVVFVPAANRNGSTNYRSGSGTLNQTVRPTPLAIRAQNKRVVQGARLPRLSWTARFANHDTPRSLARQPVCKARVHLDALGRVTSAPGRYAVLCSQAVDPNYLMRYKAGRLTVIRRRS